MSYRRESLSESSAVPIVIAFPRGSVFSTAEISSKFPSSKIPVENINVMYPDLRGAVDTAAIMWYLKPENYSPKGEINIVLVVINADSVKTYFIDNNNDRIFGDDEEKFTMDKTTERKSVAIKILGNSYRYTLMNPDYVPPVADKTRLPRYARDWKEASRRPAVGIGFELLTGGGFGRISFIPSESSVDLYKYQANVVGVMKPTVLIDFSWFNIHITGSGAFERLQYDETVLYAFDEAIKKGVQRWYDRGSWPTLKVHTIVSAEYDIKVRNIYFSPYASYSVYKNLDDVKFDRSLTIPPDAEYHQTHSQDFGIKMKIPVGEQTQIYIKYTYSVSWFDVSDYILPYVAGTYDVKYYQNLFGIGIVYRLFR